MAEDPIDPVDDEAEDAPAPAARGPLRFKAKLATQEVEVEEEDGTVLRLVLREMMSDGIEKWMQFTASRAVEKKNIKDANFKNLQANLITLCLFQKDGTAVPVSRIRKWGAATINGLFDECQTMNGLNEEGKDKAKKV